MSPSPRAKGAAPKPASARPQAQPKGEVRAFARIGRSTALAVAAVTLPKRRSIRARFSADGEGPPLDCFAMPIPPGEEVCLLVVHSPSGQTLPAHGRLTLAAGPERIPLAPDNVASVTVGPARLASAHLAALDPDERRWLLDRLIDTTQGEGGTEAAQALSDLRDELRERLAAAKLEPGAAHAINVDALWRIDGASYYVEGWAMDRRHRLQQLTVVSPEGREVDIQDHAFRYVRPDVSEFFGMSPSEKLGFICYVELPEPTQLDERWLLQARTADGGTEVSMSAVEKPDLELRGAILHGLAHERLPSESLRALHVRPALERLEARSSGTITIETVDQYGTPPQDPDVTIVVPLYRQLEFLESQLAEFVQDPEIGRSDLVYVLDSPEDAGSLRTLADELFPLYGVPFRVAVLSANGGFSAANNLGASLARGRLLLLLNSDVLPARPGWLSKLAEFYDAHPGIGALGPKLLYEDDSLQHAGMYFHRASGATTWSNEHWFKGLHRDFPPANETRPVPALTGACLMIDTHTYESLGGMSGDYVRGDYEDSDLCLRIRQSGREVWYLADVELYHLEGQSYPTRERALTSDYNRWLHTYRWRGVLETLGDADSEGAGQVPAPAVELR